jgi:hypothetical protein
MPAAARCCTMPADAGNLAAGDCLLHLGADPNATDAGGHAPLYGVGNTCTAETGAAAVHTLVQAGAQVDARDGVLRCTALHMQPAAATSR